MNAEKEKVSVRRSKRKPLQPTKGAFTLNALNGKEPERGDNSPDVSVRESQEFVKQETLVVPSAISKTEFSAPERKLRSYSKNVRKDLGRENAAPNAGEEIPGISEESNDVKLSPGAEAVGELDIKPKFFKCQSKGCKLQFTSDEKRMCHFKRKHQGMKNPFTCRNCSKTFGAKVRLTRHLERHEREGKTYECDTCGKSFPTERKLEYHSYQHSQKWGLYCDICKKGFPAGQEHRLVNHRKIHDDSRPRPFRCRFCGRTFTLRQYLDIHQKNHPVQPDDDGLYRCGVDNCGYSFKSATSYREHEKLHTGELPFECEVCGKRFGYVTSRKKHMLSHTDEKVHECHLCGKKFKTKGNLNLHLSRHSGIKPFKCTFSGCNYRFFDQHKLQSHLDVHTGTKIYKCGDCEKCFRTTTGLKSHYAIVHVKERKYKCHCGKTFTQKQYLRHHEVQHSEIDSERFRCGDCGKKFKEPSSLREHQRRFHTGETCFCCEQCGYTACFKSRLHKHMLSHSSPQFDCKTCGKQFKQTSGLNRHVATVHCVKIKIGR